MIIEQFSARISPSKIEPAVSLPVLKILIKETLFKNCLFLLFLFSSSVYAFYIYSTAQNYRNKQNLLVLASFAHSFALLIWTYLWKCMHSNVLYPNI